MGLLVGGPNAWKVVSRGEVAVAFHWINDEPSMVLFPTRGRMLLNNSMPYVLPISRAHELIKAGTNGNRIDPISMLETAGIATLVMGFGEDRHIQSKVAHIIESHLDDLCDMPPKPPALEKAEQPAPTGELAIKVDGKTVFEGEA